VVGADPTYREVERLSLHSPEQAGSEADVNLQPDLRVLGPEGFEHLARPAGHIFRDAESQWPNLTRPRKAKARVFVQAQDGVRVTEEQLAGRRQADGSSAACKQRVTCLALQSLNLRAHGGLSRIAAWPPHV
jgi:hypothetical protein